MKGLRLRWLRGTLIMDLSVGLVCIVAVTAAFSLYFYNVAETDMLHNARFAEKLLANYEQLDYDAFFQSCTDYAESFDDWEMVELLLVSADGDLLTFSGTSRAPAAPGTQDAQQAIRTGQISSFTGKSPRTGAWVISVSCPVIYDSEPVGVFQYVTPVLKIVRQVASVTAICVGVAMLLVLAVLIKSNRGIHSILVPLSEIIDKSQKIANGSYGIQIQNRFDDEIGELAQIINDLSLKISENEKIQRDFISSLSHELRTPLTAITGWGETLLSSDKLDPDTRRGVRIIHREADRLTGMVVDLLDFTRIQDDRMTLNMEMVDIRGEFEDTVFMYGSRLSEEGISLKYVDNDQEIPEISCDPQRLRQVFLNILNNAVKHGGDGKCIDASIVYQDDYVVVQIRDYGPGIPPDELGLVKKKFYKGSSKARGSGIGLAVSDEIVQMHGGELILENALTGGTLVTIRIPANQ